MQRIGYLYVALFVLILTACSVAPKKSGGYYQDDGPADGIPQGLFQVPDAVPIFEPYRQAANRPYVVLGNTYTPITDERPFKQRGIGSWYGKKFHNKKTSSGEPYDMYKMTAAHPILPIPSYVRVTNLKTGARVVVRVNDRGPFHAGRIIDLSYTAALKLGYINSGSAELEVERVFPESVNISGSAQQIGLTEKVVGQFYLQFGAYGQLANVDQARTRLMSELASLVSKFDIVAINGIYRLYAGPYSSRAEADKLLQQIRQYSSTQPIIVQR